MKNLYLLFVAMAVLTFTSCSSSNSDDPTPTPTNYTIIYKVVSTGTVMMDTIMYMDANGREKYIVGESQLDTSFTMPSNNYHAKFYMRGEIGEMGSCTYTVAAMDTDSSFANYYNGNYGFQGDFFKKTVEFSQSSN